MEHHLDLIQPVKPSSIINSSSIYFRFSPAFFESSGVDIHRVRVALPPLVQDIRSFFSEVTEGYIHHIYHETNIVVD